MDERGNFRVEDKALFRGGIVGDAVVDDAVA